MRLAVCKSFKAKWWIRRYSLDFQGKSGEVHKRTARSGYSREGVDGALKGVVSFTIPEGQEAYTEFNPEGKIDLYLSSLSIYKRMSLDVVKVGGLTKILVEKKRLLRDKYLDRLKEEYKKAK